MEFDRENIILFHKELDEYLTVLGEKYGIELSTGRLTYDEDEYTCKITGRQPNVDFDLKQWCDNCWKQDFEPKDYGRLFKYEGDTYQIAGINTRKYKSPIKLVRLRDRELFTASSYFVKQALESPENK